jgi:hypothetical protein
MGQTSQLVVEVWLLAAGESKATGGSLRQRIVTAGDFLLKTGRLKSGDLRPKPNETAEAMLERLSATELIGSLKGIDFNSPVTPLSSLPDQVYVQYVKQHRGHWFTNTGLTQDAVGLASGFRTRKLFKPAGSVAALESRAKSIRDFWSADKLFKWSELQSKWEVIQQQAARRNPPLTLTDGHFELLKKKLVGQSTQGGGVQYFVANPSQMTEI